MMDTLFEVFKNPEFTNWFSQQIGAKKPSHLKIITFIIDFTFPMTIMSGKEFCSPIYGPIFHLDYSENITNTPKFGPQHARFSKQQIPSLCSYVYLFWKQIFLSPVRNNET